MVKQSQSSFLQQPMDFEKKYPIPQRPNENIIVQWTRGYQQVELYFQDRLIGQIEGAIKLKKGITLDTDEGTIFLKLSEKPITIDIVINGYHSSKNISHPSKQLKKSATFFWLIFSFALIGSLLEGMQLSIGPMLGIVLTINIILLIGYLIAAIFVGQSKPWAFYLGFSIYCLTTLFALLALPMGNIMTFLAFLVRAALLYFLITNIKYAASTYRHNLLDQKNKNDLLDQ